MIIKLVPNVSVFRIALRCIKHWAKVRSIFVLFFLGVKYMEKKKTRSGAFMETN